MAKADHIIKYLGQYTHRVAISNQRIPKITDTHVVFIAKDYRDKAKKKPARLTGAEFLRRFCLHVLPKQFVKIRRFGIYNHTTKRNLNLLFEAEPSIIDKDLPSINRKETTQDRIKRLTGFDIGKCNKCSKGRMLLARELPRIRSPSQTIIMCILTVTSFKPFLIFIFMKTNVVLPKT